MSIPPAAARALLKKIARLRILVVGDVMLDHYIWGDATRLSPEAPVPVVHIHRDDDYKAGGAANVALNLTALGAAAELCGAVGDDENGRRLEKLLQQRHVAFDPAFRTQAPTIIKTRIIVRNQQLCRLDKEEHWKAYSKVSVDHRNHLKEKASAADAVILSDYAKGFLSPALAKELRDAAHRTGKFVAWDPKPPRGRVDATDLDLVTPNRHEAIELSGLNVGEDDRDVRADVCRRIWEKFRPRNLVVTLGGDGMLLSREGRVEKEIPTAAREVFDVSGAGDTVIASLTLALVAGADLETAAHFANAAAGVVVGKLGTATVTPDELLAHLHPE